MLKFIRREKYLVKVLLLNWVHVHGVPFTRREEEEEVARSNHKPLLVDSKLRLLKLIL